MKLYSIPAGDFCRKRSMEECIFGNITFHIECPINKNALLQSDV